VLEVLAPLSHFLSACSSQSAHRNSRIRGRPLRDPDLRAPCPNSTLSSPEHAADPPGARPPGPPLSTAAGLMGWSGMEVRPEWDLGKMRELRFVVMVLVISLPCFSASDRQGTTPLPYRSCKVTLSCPISRRLSLRSHECVLGTC
jgi:hypothetical protein